MKTASVTVVDSFGGTGSVVVEDIVGNIDKAGELADFVKTHSDGKVVGYSLTETVQVTNDDFDEGAYDKCRQRASLSYTNAEGKTKRFGYPAPRDEDIDTDQQVDSDVAEDVKDLLVSLCGGSFTYNGGYLASKRPPRLKKVLTGV